MNAETNRLPRGTVTLLFTDIEGSTRLLQHSPDAYAGILERQRVLIEQAVVGCSGVVVDAAGDSVFAAFSRAADAIRAAVAARRAIRDEGWPQTEPLRVRMGLHTGGLEEFPDGVWYIDLAPLADATLLVQTVAGVLGVREHPESPFDELLVDFLRSKRLLLLLDNCEHLLDACAALSSRLLSSCPELHILATSREALGVSGEWIRRVPPLGVPPRGSGPSAGEVPQEIARSEAVELFMERARAVSQSFALTVQNAQAVAEICRRLDGIPLAIELAASRVKLLSAEEIDRRLDDRFRLLTGGARTALPRQQTLKALIDWSYEFLAPREQAMLRRLSVFVCGWTLRAAEEICSGEGLAAEEVLDLVTALVDKSLVVVEAEEGETRYRLLETIRQYACERMLAEGESQALRDRHLRYFLDFVEGADARLRGAEQQHWLALLDRNDDDLRAALGWASTSGMGAELARLAASLWRYWRVRSNFTEGRRWLEEAIALSSREGGGLRGETLRLRSRCLISAGSLANYQGDYRRAAEALSEGLSLCRQTGDRPGTANSLTILAHSRLMTGDDSEAEEMLNEALAIFSQLDRKRGVGYAKYCLGSLMVRRGDYATACDLLEAGLSLMEELDDSWWIENTLLELGWAKGRLGEREEALRALERAQSIAESFHDRRGTARALMHIAGVMFAAGELAQTAEHYRESLRRFAEIGDRWGTVSCIEGIAAVAIRAGHASRAVGLLGAAAAIRESLNSTVRTLERGEHATLVDEAKTALGGAEFDRLFREGYRMPAGAALSWALALEP